MNLLEVKIKEQKDVSSYIEEKRNHFSEVWNKIAFSIGIRKPLVEFELKIIFDFMTDQFKTMNLNDVKRAFNLYAGQKLDFKDSHFQSLDNVFIGNVLKSFREFARKEKLIIKPQTNPERLLGNDLDPKHEQKKAFEFIEKEIKEKGEFPIIANWSEAYLHAEREKLIQFTNEEKFKIAERVKARIENEVMQEKRIRGIVKGLDLELSKGNLKTQCRKETLIQYFDISN